MKLIRIIITVCAAALLALLSALPVAALTSEQIDNFTSSITISRDNVATITEVIEYDFGQSYHHGIERFVPVKTKAGDTGKHYYYDFKFLNAAADNHGVKVSVYNSGDYKVMRLGDPNRTITGPHTYAITYQLSPVIEKDQQGDYFNWNLSGNNWEVPITSFAATVKFPDGTNVMQSRCYSGPTGSIAQDCSIEGSGNQLSISNNAALQPGEGITLNALTSAGSVNQYLEPGYPPLWQWLPGFGFIVGVLAVLLGMCLRFIRWLGYRYRRSQELVIAQYEAPDGLSPGEIGLLNDNVAGMTEITATLIDLAVRGYIKIEQTQAKALFKKAEYTFHLRKKYADVRDYEKQLLDMLFGNGTNQSVKLKDITASTASTTIKHIKDKFKDGLEKKGYYAAYQKQNWWRKLKRRLIGLVLFTAVALNVYSFVKGASFGFTLFSTLVALIGSVIGWAIAQRTELSTAGYQEWAKIEGLKLFLTVTEKERLKFHDAPAKNPKLFNKLLPYAIALGVEKQWAKQFEGMDIEKSTGWYSGSGHFNSYLLASSLSSDFSSSVTSNFTPTQSSGGGFSGGGFSGGGGGGGGGGSW